MGEEVLPHGVSMFRLATCVKPASDCNPVPPMTAIGIGSTEVGVGKRRRAWDFIRSYQSRRSQRSPSCGSRCVLDESGPR